MGHETVTSLRTEDVKYDGGRLLINYNFWTQHYVFPSYFSLQFSLPLNLWHFLFLCHFIVDLYTLRQMVCKLIFPRFNILA